MNPIPDGPEHFPLPATSGQTRPRGDARRAGPVDIPLPTIVAALMIAMAGAGTWLMSARKADAPPAATIVKRTAPAAIAPPPAAPAPIAPPSVFISKILPPKPAPAPLPEPPTADESSFVDASTALSPEPERVQFKHLSGFTPIVSLIAEAGPTFYSRPPSAPTAPSAPAPNAAGNQPCPDCSRAAANSGASKWEKPTYYVDASMEFVGRCKDGGYIYRITNHGGTTLPPDLVAPDGELWRSGGIKPSQSAEIRSRAPINDIEFDHR